MAMSTTISLKDVPQDYESFKAEFEAELRGWLQQQAARSAEIDSSPVLTIDVKDYLSTRSWSYEHIITHLYQLISSICLEEKIGIEHDNDVDVRIRLVPFPSAISPDAAHYSAAVGGTFDHLHLGHKVLLTVTALALAPVALQEASDNHPRELIVGITGDELLKNKKYASVLESWDQRQEAVYNFTAGILTDEPPKSVIRRSGTGPNEHEVRYTLADGLVLRCVEIQDAFGPTITEEGISALVVSQETLPGAKAVNQKRAEKGWDVLEIFGVEVLDPTGDDLESGGTRKNFDSKISSTEIRRLLVEKAKGKMM